MGDLNAKLPPYNTTYNRNGTALENILLSSNGQILNDPDSSNYTSYYTSLNTNSHAVLDYFIGSEALASKLSHYSTMPKTNFDIYQNKYYHVPIKAIFNIERDETPEINVNRAYIYAKADWQLFREVLQRKESSQNDIEALNEEIHRNIKDAADVSIPRSSAKTGQKNNLPEHIRKLIKLKNFWQRQYDKSNSEMDKNNLYYMKNLIKEEIRMLRSSQWTEFMKKTGPNPLSSVPFWKRINRLRQRKKPNTIGTLERDGVAYTKDEDKAKIFAERLFETFNENSRESFDVNFKEKINSYVNGKKYLQEYTGEAQAVKIFTKKELQTAMMSINNKPSIDHLGISNKILKNVPNATKDSILTVFNKCLKENRIPLSWKTSVVTMIQKKTDDKRNPKNYRPISITSCLARLFERMILKHLQIHLRNNNILLKNQSGFRARRSTRDNLYFLSQKVLECFNKKKKSVCVLFDIASAFDRVWHQGLIYKLVKAKTPLYLVNIIQTFLTNRSFSVKVTYTKHQNTE